MHFISNPYSLLQRIAGKSYPVLIYFSGGRNNGGGNTALPGQVIAEKDVVVVVSNYRVGDIGAWVDCLVVCLLDCVRVRLC